MNKKLKSKGFEISLGRTLLRSKDTNKIFIHPPYGEDNFINLANEIERDRLEKPTFGDLVEFVYSALTLNETNIDLKYSIFYSLPYFLMKHGQLLSFTGIYSVNNKGVYIEDFPKLLWCNCGFNRVVFDENNLIERLEKEDKRLRYVPFGFKEGIQTSDEIVKNPFILALCGSGEIAIRRTEMLSEIGKVSFSNFNRSINEKYLISIGYEPGITIIEKARADDSEGDTRGYTFAWMKGDEKNEE
ncbi:hypothetical protein HYW75_00860 [Candidatus Pacearchaeota archaeon]|nr:hypothetical protein [Candidatus Pacearchaeota archaeon]